MVDLTRIKDAFRRQLAAQPGKSPHFTQADGLIMLDSRTERHPTLIAHKPALCMVLQGAKWTAFGDRRVDYRAGQAMVVGLEMPGFSQVVEGSDDAPYYSLVIELDPAILREVFEALKLPPAPSTAPNEGAFVIDLDARLVDCAARMLEMLDQPNAVQVLFPGLMREMCYLLLTGPHSGTFIRVMFGGAQARGMIDAIRQVREDFDKTLPLAELARRSGFSPSAFHRKFKALTGMTPLGYQKHLRLLESRRLMLTEKLSAETAAFTVGYASPSQFSREYTRMFGAPPRKDIKTLSRTVA